MAVAWHDVTRPLRTGMPVFPGDAQVLIERVSAIADGEMANLSRAELGLHAGTHVDAPLHFVEGGGGVETLDTDVLVGDAWLADASGLEGDLGAAELERLGIPEGAERLLLRTSGGELWSAGVFSDAYPGLTGDGATWLVGRGIRLVGIDYMSIAPYADPAPAHRVLLGAGVVVVESLDLDGLPHGAYELIVLPLLVPGADGAPARALVRPASTR